MKHFKARLTRISSTHMNLRTDFVDGICNSLPEVGYRVTLIGAPVDNIADCRLVQTTDVKEVLKISEKIYEFKTQNSHYRLEVLE